MSIFTNCVHGVGYGPLEDCPACTIVWHEERLADARRNVAKHEAALRRLAYFPAENPPLGSEPPCDEGNRATDASDLFDAMADALVEGAPTLSLQKGWIWIDGETAFDAQAILSRLHGIKKEESR